MVNTFSMLQDLHVAYARSKTCCLNLSLKKLYLIVYCYSVLTHLTIANVSGLHSMQMFLHRTAGLQI